MDTDIISQIREGGLLYIILLIAITMREFGRAFVANKCKDPLPRLQGRVTINPLAHIDPMGTVILPLITIAISLGANFPLVFGWGKPVELALNNPKTKEKLEFATTLGGLSMNLVLAGISAILLAILARFSLEEFARVAMQSIVINCALFVINMIPFPPFDGGRILKYFTKMSDSTFYHYARYGIWIILIIIMIPTTANILGMAIRLLANVFMLFADIIFKIIS